ncbi:DNA translocase FtsK [bacterium]|nr:DNA translocase FtsK [bacterium]
MFEASPKVNAVPNPKEKEILPSEIRLEVTGLVLLGLIVIHIIGMIDNDAQNIMGYVVYKGLKPIIGGYGLYMLPLTFLVMSVSCILHRENKIVNAIAQLICLICLLALPIMRLILRIRLGGFYHPSDDAWVGLIGKFFGSIFETAFGNAGGIVVFIVLGLISLPYVTGYAPTKLIAGLIALKNKLTRIDDTPVNKKKAKRKVTVSSLDRDDDEQKKDLQSDISLVDSFSAGSEIPTVKKTNGTPKEQMELDFKPMLREIGKYKFPTTDLLEKPIDNLLDTDREKIVSVIETSLANFNVAVNVTGMTIGPSVIRCELKPAPGVSVKKVIALQDDLKLALKAKRLRIEAPIPGKDVIGVEFPKSSRNLVTLREVLECDAFTKSKSLMPLCIGKDVDGDPIIEDLNKMPHLLIAGQTGAGKSVCLNSIVMSLLFKAAPDEVKLILIDPKRVELILYNSLPHLLVPVIIDWNKARNALMWVIKEMNNRYNQFQDIKCRDILMYNKKRPDGEFMPYIVIIIDEFASLIDAPNGKELMRLINHIARLARATGIHVIAATQRPEVKVISGGVKSNFPARIAFSVTSHADSTTILGKGGADKLLGQGDMLYSSPSESGPRRAQGTFIGDDETEKVVSFLTSQIKPEYRADITKYQGEIDDIDGIEELEDDIITGFESEDDDEEYFQMAVKLAHEKKSISASMIQRDFRIGYLRASRIIDKMEKLGIISGMDGHRKRRLIQGNDFMDSIDNP